MLNYRDFCDVEIVDKERCAQIFDSYSFTYRYTYQVVNKTAKIIQNFEIYLYGRLKYTGAIDPPATK